MPDAQPTRTPIDKLMAAVAIAQRKLGQFDEAQFLARAERRKICDELSALATDVHHATPELAESILADAVLAVADAYPDSVEAYGVMIAARDLVAKLRAKVSPDPDPRWEKKAGLMG